MSSRGLDHDHVTLGALLPESSNVSKGRGVGKKTTRRATTTGRRKRSSSKTRKSTSSTRGSRRAKSTRKPRVKRSSTRDVYDSVADSNVTSSMMPLPGAIQWANGGGSSQVPLSFGSQNPHGNQTISNYSGSASGSAASLSSTPYMIPTGLPSGNSTAASRPSSFTQQQPFVAGPMSQVRSEASLPVTNTVNMAKVASERGQAVRTLEAKSHLIQEISQRIQAEKMRLQQVQAEAQELEEMIRRLDEEATGKSSIVDWNSENFAHSGALREALKRWFGYDEFRSLQLSALNATLSMMDTFVVMPTGSGKSLIYQLPPLVEKKLTVVVCPLLSLSRDQVLSLNKRGVMATMLSSETSREQAVQVNAMLKSGQLQLLYITPEKFVKSKRLLGDLEKLNERGMLGRFVIDEAHCCSTMGHDFRPDYNRLHLIKNRFPNLPILAVTATATIVVQNQVRATLLGPRSNEKSWKVFRTTFNRTNLYYEVIQKRRTGAAQMEQIAEVIKTRFGNQCGIVYCFTRKDTEETAKALCGLGIRAACYHAYLSPSQKESTHLGWTSWAEAQPNHGNSIQVICATSAFGMGIDKPDVRFVIHRTMPKTMESYCQESGRAGRDGKPAACILFYQPTDILRVSVLVSTQANGLDQLRSMVRFCESRRDCRRLIMADVFGETLDPQTACNKKCDICKGMDDFDANFKKEDVTEAAVSMIQLMSKCVKGKEGRTTMVKFVPAWRPKGWSVAKVEQLCAHLIMTGVFSITWTDTAYTTNAYLGLGSAASLVLMKKRPIQLYFPRTKTKSPAKKKVVTSKGAAFVQPRTTISLDSDSEEELLLSLAEEEYFANEMKKENDAEVVQVEMPKEPVTSFNQGCTAPSFNLASDSDSDSDSEEELEFDTLPPKKKVCVEPKRKQTDQVEKPTAPKSTPEVIGNILIKSEDSSELHAMNQRPNFALDSDSDSDLDSNPEPDLASPPEVDKSGDVFYDVQTKTSPVHTLAIKATEGLEGAASKPSPNQAVSSQTQAGTGSSVSQSSGQASQNSFSKEHFCLNMDSSDEDEIIETDEKNMQSFSQQASSDTSKTGSILLQNQDRANSSVSGDSDSDSDFER